MLKFKHLVKKINRILDYEYMEDLVEPSQVVHNVDQLLIYNYEKLNDYGKAILENSYCFNPDSWGKIDMTSESKMTYAEKYIDDNSFGLVFKNRYLFIFWSLMILAVDKTKKEEKLTLISDFAVALDIDKDSVLDIVRIVEIVLKIVTLSERDVDIIDHACYADREIFENQGSAGFNNIEVVLEMRDLIKIYN